MLDIIKFLVPYFNDIIKDVIEISKADFHSARASYDEYFKEKITEIHYELESNGLCNKFDEDNLIFWAYFTKMMNIIIYDLTTHIELVKPTEFHKIEWFIHVPIDNKVMSELNKRIRTLADLEKMNEIDTSLEFYKRLDSINSKKLYFQIQKAIRLVQDERKEPPIYIEDVYSLT